MTNKPSDNRRKKHLQKTLALLIPSLSILGLLLTITPFTQEVWTTPTDTTDAVAQNIGRALILAAAIIAFALKRTQNGAYWPAWLQIQRPVLDERQKNIRHQVYERSYFGALCILLFTSIYIHQCMVYSSDVREYAVTAIMWITAILLISLPSIIAALRDDT